MARERIWEMRGSLTPSSVPMSLRREPPGELPDHPLDQGAVSVHPPLEGVLVGGAGHVSQRGYLFRKERGACGRPVILLRLGSHRLAHGGRFLTHVRGCATLLRALQ